MDFAIFRNWTAPVRSKIEFSAAVRSRSLLQREGTLPATTLASPSPAPLLSSASPARLQRKALALLSHWQRAYLLLSLSAITAAHLTVAPRLPIVVLMSGRLSLAPCTDLYRPCATGTNQYQLGISCDMGED